MSSGMNTEQAKEYAKTMTYREAVSNVRFSKGIKYRKATMIKLRELAIIADRLDRKDEPQTSCKTCRYGEVDEGYVRCAYYSKSTEHTEPQKWTKENCKGCKYNEYPYDSGTCFIRVCINGNKYEPKDEPQTERSKE